VARGGGRTPGLAGLAVVAAASLLTCRGAGDTHSDLSAPPSPSPSGAAEPVGPPSAGGRLVPVTRVVDGDTFHVLRSGRDVTIRLIGVDTPEVGWYGGDPECYGARAGLFARHLLEGERVRLEFDVERIDPYDRTLAYAYLKDGRMVNALLVRRGLAEVTIFEPNDRYEPRLRAAERAARAREAGLWSTCPPDDGPG
jgi:micrococcal nuclease